MEPLGAAMALDRERSLLEMVNEAQKRLQVMEISCRSTLGGADGAAQTPRAGNDGDSQRQIELLQIQVAQLRAQLVDVVHKREDSDAIFQRAMVYAASKGTANGVLHTLFDQASSGKYQVLESWFETGVIPTRDGLKHWRLDPRDIRNDSGDSLLHVAVSASMARQNLKVKLVELLVDRMGFDVNVRDAFGRTPLHAASIAGLAEVVQALLDRGADASLQDRAGLTPLSLVRTLSKPPEEVVQLLANAESVVARDYMAASHCIPPKKAIVSALFLRSLARFLRQRDAAMYSEQTNALLNALLRAKDEPSVALDQLLQELVPCLFDESKTQLVRLDSLFLGSMHVDPDFVDDLKLEAAAYGHSLVTSTCATAAALAGATWEGLVLKMIAAFKLEIASSSTTPRPNGAEVESVRPHTPSGLDTPPRSLMYADHRSSTATSRQGWHYAVLYKSATRPFPGTLRVRDGESSATCSEDVSRFFPLEDRLIIGASEFYATSYDASSQTLELDRAFDGKDADSVKAYLAGSCSSLNPPYISTKRIWEREPGNKYEDHQSHEQELLQDYQFLDPDSEYEVAVKFGPLSSAAEARAIVDEWKRRVRRLFEEKKCRSGLPSCEHYCPQRSRHSLCVETMAVLGRELAKEKFGRPTLSKPLKPRASLQKYQNLFQGNAPWPGSPSMGPAASSVSSSARVPSPDFT